MFERFIKSTSKIKQMKIKIFNQNTWLIPFPFSKHGRSRINNLFGTIKNLNPDIVTLQEVTLSSHVKKIKKTFPEYFLMHGAGRFGNRSGSLTMTKEKPLLSKFVSFPKAKVRRLHKIIKRGFFVIKLKNFFLINAHLYPGNWNPELTLQEFEILKKQCDKKKITIVAGDLNLNYEIFDKVNNNFFECVDAVGNTFSFFNKYVKKWWERTITANKKIDYILVRNPNKKQIIFKSRIIRKPLISDHYGIYSEIEIK